MAKLTKKKLTVQEQQEKEQEKFWEQVDYLAQEKIYELLIRNLPLPGLKLITHSYNYTDQHQSLTGLFCHKDVDYRTLLGDIESSYSDYQDLPKPEYLAEEIALNYCYLLMKSLIADLQAYSGYDPSYFANLTNYE